MSNVPAPTSRTRRAVTPVLVVLACVVGALLMPAAAVATAYPSPPTGLHITSVSATSFTVATHASANAHSYRVYASTLKSDLYYAHISAGTKSAARRTATGSRPSVSVTGLKFTTAPYYYRVEAINGSRHSFSSVIGSVGLRPAVPTGLKVTSGSGGTYLTWSSGRTTGFVIAQATNAAMTTHRRTYSIHGASHQFTPYSLSDGTTYYFQIRATNNHTSSAYSAHAHGTVESKEQAVKVMTYNILQLSDDGNHEAGGVVAAWSKRRMPAAELIKSAAPDVVAVEEGYPWVGKVRGARQVDSLRTALASAGAKYTLAHTEIAPSERGYFRTGDYILYNPTTYEAVGGGGHWTIGDSHYAAWQELKNRKTGARFLFVSTHLQVGMGASYDTKREHETQSLLKQAKAKAAAAKVPVVYAGDFNSDALKKQHTLDGPGVAMAAAHVADARDAAQAHTNARYDSVSELHRTPPAYALDIDYVFAPAGVAVSSWGMSLHLSHGKYVGTIPSDHNPVYARVVIPYQP